MLVQFVSGFALVHEGHSESGFGLRVHGLVVQVFPDLAVVRVVDLDPRESLKRLDSPNCVFLHIRCVLIILLDC